MYEQLTAADSTKKQKAEERLQRRVQVGAAEQIAVIKTALETVITDRIVYPASMNFRATVDGENNSSGVRMTYVGEIGKIYDIHTHALGQMAKVADLSGVHITKLRVGGAEKGAGWKHELLAHTLNEFFHKEKFTDNRGRDLGYLRRSVGDQIRGFQGRSFGRNLATAPLLRAFVEECGVHAAGPIDAKASATVTTLKCAMPYVFEPVAGEFIAFGVSFKNSDFGAAKLTVAGTLMRISSGTIAVLEGSLNKVHLGKIIDSDDDMILSEETIGKELDAAKSAVTDIIRSTLSPANVKQVLEQIALAHTRAINWFDLSQQLSKVLSKQDLEFAKQLMNVGDDLMDLPPIRNKDDSKSTATVWWASNLVGWFANKEEDTERRQALQELAGEILSR
jgi:hypothetical protein